MPALIDRPQLYNQFNNVKLFYDEKSDLAVNYEHLFNLTAPDGFSDPPPSSLFNIQTLT